MIYTNLRYNPTTDLAAVEPFGYINLCDAVEKGEIPAGIANSELEYNNIDNPQTIMGKPSDIFEAYRMADSIKASVKANKERAQLQSQLDNA